MSLTKTIAEVAEGRHDGNLHDLMLAIRHRIEAGATAFLWRVTFEDVTVTEEDVTLDEMETAERIAGRNWSQLNPAVSAGNCRALLIAALVSRQGMSEKDARERVGKVAVHSLLDGIDSYEVTPPPFEDGPDGQTSG